MEQKYIDALLWLAAWIVAAAVWAYFRRDEIGKYRESFTDIRFDFISHLTKNWWKT